MTHYTDYIFSLRMICDLQCLQVHDVIDRYNDRTFVMWQSSRWRSCQILNNTMTNWDQPPTKKTWNYNRSKVLCVYNLNLLAKDLINVQIIIFPKTWYCVDCRQKEITGTPIQSSKPWRNFTIWTCYNKHQKILNCYVMSLIQYGCKWGIILSQGKRILKPKDWLRF